MSLHPVGAVETPVISVDPERLWFPLLTFEEGYIAFDIRLNITGLSDFMDFQPVFSYDPDVIEYLGPGGNHTYQFRVIGIGNTNISVRNSKLLDYLDNPVSFNYSDCDVSISSLEGEVEKLSDEISDLNFNYTELLVDYEELYDYNQQILSTISELSQEKFTLQAIIAAMEAQSSHTEAEFNETQAQLTQEIQHLESELSHSQKNVQQSTNINIFLSVVSLGLIIVLAYTRKK